MIVFSLIVNRKKYTSYNQDRIQISLISLQGEDKFLQKRAYKDLNKARSFKLQGKEGEKL